MAFLFRPPAVLPDERSHLEAFRRVAEAIEQAKAFAARIIDRREQVSLRVRPGDAARVVGGQAVILPPPRPSEGRIILLLVESPTVVVQAEQGLVNSAATVSLTASGLGIFVSSGSEWFATGAGL